jgi:hypothetical protein
MYSPKSLALPHSMLDEIPKTSKPPRHKQGEKFLRGPVPYTWITTAARLPGKALHVAIAMWFQAGLNDNRTVKLSPKILRDLGIERRTGYRALKALEGAGLISIERQVGSAPQVTLLDHPHEARGA